MSTRTMKSTGLRRPSVASRDIVWGDDDLASFDVGKDKAVFTPKAPPLSTDPALIRSSQDGMAIPQGDITSKRNINIMCGTDTFDEEEEKDAEPFMKRTRGPHVVSEKPKPKPTLPLVAGSTTSTSFPIPTPTPVNGLVLGQTRGSISGPSAPPLPTPLPTPLPPRMAPSVAQTTNTRAPPIPVAAPNPTPAPAPSPSLQAIPVSAPQPPPARAALGLPSAGQAQHAAPARPAVGPIVNGAVPVPPASVTATTAQQAMPPRATPPPRAPSPPRTLSGAVTRAPPVVAGPSRPTTEPMPAAAAASLAQRPPSTVVRPSPSTSVPKISDATKSGLSVFVIISVIALIAMFVFLYKTKQQMSRV